VKQAAGVDGSDFRNFTTRIRPRFDTWVRLEHADPAKTRVTMVRTMYELSGEPYPFFDRVQPWQPREVEDFLERHRGTGRQTIDSTRRTIVKLMLDNPMLTTVDLLEAQERLEEMGDLELERRHLMQTGRLDRASLGFKRR
jgi:hypothetical protein